MSNPESGEEVTFTVEDTEPLRIDVRLTKTFPNQSRSYFQKLIDSGLVLLNNSTPKKQTRPEQGDKITVTFQLNQEIRLDPEDIPLDFVYEDEHFVCINKPPGMVVHPAPGNWNGTLANALLYHFNQLPGQNKLRPGIVHRLDKDTSGLILIAKTPECHRELITTFSERKIQKKYLAITWGKPNELSITAHMGRHPRDRKKQYIFKEEEAGKVSHTDFEILALNNHYYLIEAKPYTGRTHQIRVHLQFLGAPILGDPMYGSKTANQKHPKFRLQLHAKELKFDHPITGKPLHLKAPIPRDMQHSIDHLFGSIEL